ncbi:hypothetical protein IGI04_019016 [Brassica rapa subsp. trilocularis]|uniref:Uncharacterized protein n=1 Tax=Brassica rapa subsp. trilocularis TaxID=1813537 RepID=A0ABQ7MEL7_BRACM|nr:hypothetical protein IGI04_019016 [Brassica rapa subsp. trilocularis]
MLIYKWIIQRVGNEMESAFSGFTSSSSQCLSLPRQEHIAIYSHQDDGSWRSGLDHGTRFMWDYQDWGRGRTPDNSKSGRNQSEMIQRKKAGSV